MSPLRHSLDSKDNYCTADESNGHTSDVDTQIEAESESWSNEDSASEALIEAGPNDDELTVYIDMLDATPLEEGVTTVEHPATQNLDPTESEHPALSNPTVEAYKGIEDGPNLWKQLCKIMLETEKEYWWRMCEPKEDDTEKKARKALEPKESSGGSKKQKQEERRARAETRIPKEGNRKSDTTQRKDTCFEDLVTADKAIFHAFQDIYQCNNIVLDRFNAKTVCDQLRLDRNIPKTTRQSRRSAKRSKSEPPPERKRRHWLSARVAESLGYVVYEWDKLQEMPHSPSLILDEEYCRLVIYLPGFFSPKLTEYTQELLRLGKQVKLETCQADTKTRGANYTLKPGRLAGCINMTRAWVGLGRKNTDLKPSTPGINGGHMSATKSATSFNSIQAHHRKTRKIGTMLNYALYRCHPESYWAYLKMSTILQKRIPGAAAISTHDPALSSGKSVIVSRSTPLHFDNKEAPEGWSPLIIMGTCKTGMLSIPHLKIKFLYLPGTLVFICGRLLDHEVIEWDGQDYRICVAHFTHTAEWNFTGVAPPL